MRARDIQIGGVYWCKIGGKLAKVRINSEGHSYWSGQGCRKTWNATNLATGRRIVIRSPQRLRGKVRDEPVPHCHVCRQVILPFLGCRLDGHRVCESCYREADVGAAVQA